MLLDNTVLPEREPITIEVKCHALEATDTS